MVKGVGIDIIEIERLEKALARRKLLLERLFTGQELAYCMERSRPAASFAARFAAKEAVRKACSKIMSGQVMPWREIEVVLEDGRPEIRLSGKSAQLAYGGGIVNLQVSLTHSRDYACAVVTAEGSPV
ncbi:MAG: Holo-(acyl-carrier-protein) synthase [Firmicutes bacterium]|nr:Holo-(acyl-carrier-protein) synthase [candidate division NPL-UPA2 bacterium]